jgi:hypothetical protein
MMRMKYLLIAAALLLAAACTSESTPEQPAGTETSSSPAAHGSLAECLKANGVIESSTPAMVLGPPEGVDQATWDRAMQACSSFAPGPAGP